MSKIVIICGPTASGKSSAALEVAKKTNGIIINGDALQICKDLPTLTARPLAKEQENIPHKLYGFLEANKNYSGAFWIKDSINEIEAAFKNNQTPIIVSGSGMYISLLLNGMREVPDIPEKIKEETFQRQKQLGIDGLLLDLKKQDSETENILNKNDKHRIIRAHHLLKAHNITPTEYRKLPNKIFYEKDRFDVHFLKLDRTKLYENCNSRFDNMIEKGAIDEVRKLNAQEIKEHSQCYKIIGYKEITDFLKNKITKEQAIETAKQATRNYAKRQLTWFNNQLKKTIDHNIHNNILDLINSFK